MRLLIIQYAGDYRNAFQQIQAGNCETFYAQKHSIDVVATIGQQVEEVGTLCLYCQDVYDQVLANGVRAMGAGFKGKYPPGKHKLSDLTAHIDAFQPTHLILRYPDLLLLQWARRRQLPVLMMLADSFSRKGYSVKARIQDLLLARALNQDGVAWVGNNNVPASLSLAELGVKPAKIIPWEWPAIMRPEDQPPKTLATVATPWRLIYVGSLTSAKGLDDALLAVQHLKTEGYPCRLQVFGRGEVEDYQAKAVALGIDDWVDVIGCIGHDQVMVQMRQADCILVPSRREYPEGFPKTIVEALCARTPLVASNHPVFTGILEPDVSALIFPSGNALAMANCIKRLFSNADLYHRLSLSTPEAWEKLQIPVKWADLIQHWLFDPDQGQQWLSPYSLASGYYDPGQAQPGAASPRAQSAPTPLAR